MEDDFYASIKLNTGEEIFARVLPCDEENKITLIVTNPIMITSIKGRGDSSGYKIEPWMKTTTEDMFIIHMNNVITMTETNDLEMIMIHQSFVRRIEDMKNNRHSVSRKMGYIANVNDAKELLEKIYKNSQISLRDSFLRKPILGYNCFGNIEALTDSQNQQAYYTYIPMGLSSDCYLNDYVL